MAFAKHATRLLVLSMLLLIGLLIGGCDSGGDGNDAIGDDTPSPASGTIVVTTNSGAGEWKVGSYDDLTVTVGSKLVFNYHATHDVIKMSDDSCGPSGNTELAKNDHGSGDTLANQYVYTVDDNDLNAGAIYFSCSYFPLGTYNHCSSGQKLVVNVVPA